MAAASSLFVADVLPRFTPAVDVEKYKCCKCLNILRPPVRQTVCGHRLCSLCLDKHLRSEDTMCPGQGLDDDICVDLKDPGAVTPDFGTERDLRKLPVYCDYADYGCKETPTWAKKAKHVEQCTFKPTSCHNASHGCPYQGPAATIDKHMDSCEYTLERCPHCQQAYPRKQIESHVKICLTTPKICPLSNLGCSFEGKVAELKAHTEDKNVMVYHIQILTQGLQRVEESERSLQTQVNEYETNLNQGPKRRGDPESAKMQQNLMRNYAKVSERVGKVEGRVETHLEFVRTQGEKMTALQDVSKMHESRLTQMESHGRTSGYGSADDERTKIRSIESTIGMHDIRLAEYDLRFQCMESAGYDGLLIWKIKDYQRRKMDAVSGRTLSLYSQPFYTSRFGYKMCARVYLNGDGMGKGSHMSLFFVIMKGDYDALVPWPFRQKVSLTLLDVNGTRKHLTDTFRPDPTSTSFRMPVGDMNIASGCPLFVAQSVLEAAGTYIKDDTLYIKLSVDVSDLTLP